jgi:Protein of unknown function (DUF2877)
MLAEVVATPVLERLAAAASQGVVRGATARAAYLDLDGFVVALTAPGVPLMPNGVAVPRTAVRDGPVRTRPGVIDIGGETVTWDPADPPAWEARLVVRGRGDVSALRERGTAILATLGAAPLTASDALTGGDRGRAGLDHLRRALARRDPDAAGRAAERLLGLGGGLTPEGDDVLAATAAVVSAAGDAAGFAAGERERWLAALVPADAGARTTALSATLLALAAGGAIVEPVHRLVDVSGDDAAWRQALATLAATGASTGLAYAVAAGSALTLLLGDDDGGRAPL